MFRAAPGSDVPKRRPDADPRWAMLRDELHTLTLGPLGRASLELVERKDLCSFAGRDYELWAPLLALAHYLQERGADGLVTLITEHARKTIDAGQEDQTPDADELLLKVLAEKIVSELATPTPNDILTQAKLEEPDLFCKWTARTVANHLARYGLRAVKSHGVRAFRNITRMQLVKVERHYRLDLGLSVQDPPLVASPSSPAPPVSVGPCQSMPGVINAGGAGGGAGGAAPG
jgi:hypothetical protein